MTAAALAVVAAATVAACQVTNEESERRREPPVGGTRSADVATAESMPTTPPKAPVGPVPTKRDIATLRALIALARSPRDATWSAAPFADHVHLGLANDLLERSAAVELRDKRSWKLRPPGGDFRAGVGPFSALDLLAERNRPLAFSVGRHGHCVSPPVPAPPEVASLRRISVQPRKAESCLQWFTVDAFVSESGEIRAITLDLWEP